MTARIAYGSWLIRGFLILLAVFVGGFVCYYVVRARFGLGYKINLYSPKVYLGPREGVLGPDVGIIALVAMGVGFVVVNFIVFASDNLLKKSRWILILGFLVGSFTGQLLRLLLRDFEPTLVPNTSYNSYASFAEIRHSLSFIERLYYLPLVNAIERGHGTTMYLLGYSVACGAVTAFLCYTCSYIYCRLKKRRVS